MCEFSYTICTSAPREETHTDKNQSEDDESGGDDEDESGEFNLIK